MKIMSLGAVRDVCQKCFEYHKKKNVEGSAGILYEALKAAVERGTHDQKCDQVGFEPDPDDICTCWYGKAQDALEKAEGIVS
jgi:hypothetical protein